MNTRARFKLLCCVFTQLLCVCYCKESIETVEVKSLPTIGFARQPPRTLGAQIGQSVLLPCESYQASPDVSVDVRWYKDGQAVTPGRLRSRGRSRSSAPVDNNTSFAPSLSNSNSNNSNAAVVVVSPPIADLLPSSKELPQQKQRRDRYSGASTPTPSSPAPTVLTAAPRSQDDFYPFLLPNGSLLIPKASGASGASGASAGKYQCSVSAKGQTLMSRECQLVLYVGPSFSVHPTSKSIVEGESVRFVCHSHAQPPSKYAWHLNQTKLPPSQRYLLLPGGVLQILNVTTSDSGSYDCRGTNLTGAVTSQQAQLNVKRGAAKSHLSWVFGAGISSVEVEEGSELSLECLASSHDRRITYKWERKDRTSYCEPPCTMSNGNLIIPHATKEFSSGLITCNASDGLTHINRTVNVTVYSKPQAVVKSKVMLINGTYNLVLADNERFICVGHGDPKPSVMWTKNGIPVSSRKKDGFVLEHQLEGQFPTVQLFFHHFNMASRGYYQCVASNKYGSNITTIKVDMTPGQEYPALKKPSLVFVNSTTIEIECNKTETGTTLILYYPPPKGIETVNKVSACQGGNMRCRHNLTQLTGFTNYSIYVQQLVHHKGEQPKFTLISQPLLVTTNECVPQIHAQLESVTILGPHQMVVSWLAPTKWESCGRIIYYKVEYSEVQTEGTTQATGGGKNFLEVKVDDRLRTFPRLFALLSDLTPDREYFISVLPATRIGCSEKRPQSNSEEKRTWKIAADKSCYSVAQNFTVFAQFGSAGFSQPLQVRWKISPKVKVAKFVLEVSNRAGDVVRSEDLASNLTERDVTGLDPLEMYKISVLVWSPSNTTCLNVSTAVFPGGSSSLAIPKLDAEPLGIDGAKLAWTYRATWYPDQPIAHYEVKCVPVSGPSSQSPNTTLLFNSTSTSLQVGGMRTKTKYVISVRAVFKQPVAGRTSSQFSVPVSLWTDKPVPGNSPTANIELKGRHMKAKWQPPSLSYGDILGYVLDLNCVKNNATVLDEVHNLTVSTIAKCLPSLSRCTLKVAARNSQGLGPFAIYRLVVGIGDGKLCDAAASPPSVTPKTEEDTDETWNIVAAVLISLFVLFSLVLLAYCCCTRCSNERLELCDCLWCKESAINFRDCNTHSNARPAAGRRSVSSPEATLLVRNAPHTNGVVQNGHGPPKNGIKGTNGFHKTNGFHVEPNHDKHVNINSSNSTVKSLPSQQQAPTNGRRPSRNTFFNKERTRTLSSRTDGRGVSQQGIPLLSVPIPRHTRLFQKEQSTANERIEIPPEDDVDDFLDDFPSQNTSLSHEFERIMNQYTSQQRAGIGGTTATARDDVSIALDVTSANDVTASLPQQRAGTATSRDDAPEMYFQLAGDDVAANHRRGLAPSPCKAVTAHTSPHLV